MKIKRSHAEDIDTSLLYPIPTTKLANLRSSLNQQLKIVRKDTYNENEDELTDDEVIKQIKTMKLHEQIARTDTLTDYTAVSSMVSDMKRAKRNVPARSVISKSLDLQAMRERQQKIRILIDEEKEFQTDKYNCAGSNTGLVYNRI